ncbi:alanine racemase [Litorivivens lipolytica]|uniref:Alanine racemase n=1 Tax=Litorivivens lipolytica TaxID=1524264 RepID=A0A7W4W2J7_9GAMM|nr:alanine racemase [Litorivivens lipolytica]MBB3046282.1 alanine racemase [Litorivivens lipolytica]
MDYTAWADIDLSALSHNLSQVRRCAPHSRVVTMIKANAYGHGLAEVARHLDGLADKLGIARFSEAQHLRQQGIATPLLLMGTLLSAEALRYCAGNQIAVAVHTLDQARLIAGLDTPMELWLKIDTGMNRLGLSPEEALEAYHLLAHPDQGHQLLLMTHFSSADEHTPATASQIHSFDHVAQQVADLPASLANSAAIITQPKSHRDWVRPGIMLYGSNPTDQPIDLKPVMTLKAKILAIKEVGAGNSVGYNRSWTAKENSTIAALGIGYGDGYPRQLPNGTPVLVNGQRFPIVGRISMDICSIDISSATLQIAVGDHATLWGEGLSADEIASRAGTISYHLFTGVTPRVPRHYR